MNKYPWDFNPDLKMEALTEMATFIANIRDEVIDLHDEDLGDSRLSLGMRAYECCRQRIIRASKYNLFSWLSIITFEGRFTFAIEKTPVRFTRNDPKYLPDKKLIVSDDAQYQMDLFSKSSAYATLRWFFVFDTHYKSAADAVYFVGYSESGEVVCQWQIPVEDNVVLFTDINSKNPPAVEIDAPVVAVKKVINKHNEDDVKNVKEDDS